MRTNLEHVSQISGGLELLEAAIKDGEKRSDIMFRLNDLRLEMLQLESAIAKIEPPAGFRRMDDAHRDGRHVILVPRDWTDWKDYDAWKGGLVAYWTGEGEWRVIKNPEEGFENGSGEQADSYYFLGWAPLPDEEVHVKKRATGGVLAT